MRWYEYKMEADDLHAPEDLKAKLLAMADTLPEEEKNRPMMPAQADNTAVVRPQEPPKKAKLIHFPAKPVGALAACLAVCVLGYGALSTGKLDIGAKSSNMALYSANSSAASTAGGFTTQQAMLDATPEAVTYDLDQAAVLSENDAAAAEDRQASTSPKIIYTANLTLESKDYDTARAALDAALNDAGGYLESSSEYSDVGSSRSVNLTFRVPEENYQSFLDAVAQAGNVTYKSQQADDVTTQYMDVETRLAKLVLMMCQSHEVKQLIDATFKDDVRYAVTTAFSMHPVSMKYRGVYKLHKRLEGEKGEGFRLNYYGELGLWSLDEAYALWWKKFHN